jgi:hypothetical protein
VYVFRRGTRAAAAKGSWRKGTVGATKTAEGWTLWASSAAVSGDSGPGIRGAQTPSIPHDLRLTADGVDPADPCSGEAAYSPVGRAYRYPGFVVATDGSLKDDGRMGAAFVCMGGRVSARSVAVVGAPSSTRPELTDTALALEESLSGEDLTILTDLLVAMTNFFSL